MTLLASVTLHLSGGHLVDADASESDAYLFELVRLMMVIISFTASPLKWGARSPAAYLDAHFLSKVAGDLDSAPLSTFDMGQPCCPGSEKDY